MALDDTACPMRRLSTEFIERLGDALGYETRYSRPTMLYRKTGIIEAIPWSKHIDMERVSISPADIDNHSPKDGDMIAHDPKNPDDRWLISKAYFENNYEPA